MHEGLAAGLRADIAPVNQQVGIRGERLAPGGHFLRARRQGLFIQRRVAELHRAAVAVRDQVDGGDVLSARERFGDAGQAVLVGIDQHDLDGPASLGLPGQVGQQGGLVGHARVDKDDLGAR